MIQLTDNGDGSAKVTLTQGEDDHRFSIVADGDTATVSYEETMSWLGAMRSAQPSESAFQQVMRSDEVTEWLDSYEVDHISR